MAKRTRAQSISPAEMRRKAKVRVKFFLDPDLPPTDECHVTIRSDGSITHHRWYNQTIESEGAYVILVHVVNIYRPSDIINWRMFDSLLYIVTEICAGIIIQAQLQDESVYPVYADDLGITPTNSPLLGYIINVGSTIYAYMRPGEYVWVDDFLRLTGRHERDEGIQPFVEVVWHEIQRGKHLGRYEVSRHLGNKHLAIFSNAYVEVTDPNPDTHIWIRYHREDTSNYQLLRVLENYMHDLLTFLGRVRHGKTIVP